MFSSRTNWNLAANRLSEQLQEMRRQGVALLDLTESNPTRCGFSYDRQVILGALQDPCSLNYSPDPRGLLSARQAVCEYYAEHGQRVDPDRIILTTSTSEAYSYVFRLLVNPGESIAVPRPSYPLFEFLTRLDDLQLRHYALAYDDEWRLDLEGVRRSLDSRTRAILVVNPNNPTGSFVAQEELEMLVDCCMRQRAALIADEVFLDYGFAPEASEGSDHGAAEPIMSSKTAAGILTFTLSGLSKISALPQMKLAWIVVNGPAGEAGEALGRLEIIADTYLSVSVPIQLALPALLDMRHTLQPQIRERILRNLRWLDAHLSPDSPISRLRAQGGWYVILKLPATQSDEEWSLELLRNDRVIVHPGHFYDFFSEGHLVLSLLPPPEVFEQGVLKIIARVGKTMERGT